MIKFIILVTFRVWTFLTYLVFKNAIASSNCGVRGPHTEQKPSFIHLQYYILISFCEYFVSFSSVIFTQSHLGKDDLYYHDTQMSICIQYGVFYFRCDQMDTMVYGPIWLSQHSYPRADGYVEGVAISHIGASCHTIPCYIV